MNVMNCIFDTNGRNFYALPHTRKEYLWRMLVLPTQIKVTNSAEKGDNPVSISQDAVADGPEIVET